MYLSEIFIENFRIFGPEEEGKHLRLSLRPGLNVLVGENDCGKSAIIDAIRHVLWTTSNEYHRLTEDDFHVSGERRAENLRIRCLFRGLSNPEAARFLEWLSMDGNHPCLYVTLFAARLDSGVAGRIRISVTCRAGKGGEGRAIEGTIREFLKTTYLRPLRDAEVALSAGRGSRLAQILESHPDCKDQCDCSFDEENPESCELSTLTDIMRYAEYLIGENRFIRDAEENLNKEYLKDFSIGNDVLEGKIGVAKQAELRHILEKLELWLRPKAGVELRTPRGLGVNNVLFMATELLLLGGERKNALSLLLIEEPEAHLHPQMQLRLMDFLEEKVGGTEDDGVQILVTTHSPNLASKVNLECITIVSEGQVYPLESGLTKLDPSDYRFLRRFLDVTKANLFFAKGVAIVEGDAENILLPVLAKCIDRDFSEHGVSIVKVGSRGLFRYARIFRRTDGRAVPIKVACIADRDIPPKEASYVTRKEGKPTFDSDYTSEGIDEVIQKLKMHDGAPVITFISPRWTLEHDIAYSGLAFSMHVSIQLAKGTKGKGTLLTEEEKTRIVQKTAQTLKEWKKSGWTKEQITAEIYKPLYKGEASKAETAQFLAARLEKSCISPNGLRSILPEYLTKAIDYVAGHDNPVED